MCKCCMGPLEDQSLGWPRGSVRSIIALICIPTVISAAIVLMILMYVKEQYEAATGILSTLTGFIGIIVGYYFGSKSAESAAKLVAKAEDDIVKVMEKNVEAMERGIKMRDIELDDLRNNGEYSSLKLMQEC